MAFDAGGPFNSVFGIGPEVITAENHWMMVSDPAYYNFVEERAASVAFFVLFPQCLGFYCLYIGDYYELFSYSINELSSFSYSFFDMIFRVFISIELILIVGPNAEVVASGDALYRLVAMFGFAVLVQIIFGLIVVFWLQRCLVGVASMIQFCRENAVTGEPRRECRKYWINSILGTCILFHQLMFARIFLIEVDEVGFIPDSEVAWVSSVFFYFSLKVITFICFLLFGSVLLGVLRSRKAPPSSV